MPPGSRCSAAPRITASTIASPTMPPSRYSYSGTPGARGVITNGGFDTIRSNRSPATGSKRLPSRNSTPSMPFSSTFRRARRSARSEMSVATIRSAKRDACIAWIPHPVPRSSTVRAGVGTMRPASVSDAPPTPSTCCSPSAWPSATSPRSDRIHQCPSPRASENAYGRRSSRARTDAAVPSSWGAAPSVAWSPAAPVPEVVDGVVGVDRAQESELDRAADAERGQRVRGLRRGHREAEHEQLRERREIGGCPVGRAPRVEHASRRHALAPMQCGRGIRPPERLERGHREPGRTEVVAEPREEGARAAVVGHGVEAHRTIQPHPFAGADLAPVGASAQLVARASTSGNGP